jgi:hypothetical protein
MAWVCACVLVFSEQKFPRNMRGVCKKYPSILCQCEKYWLHSFKIVSVSIYHWCVLVLAMCWLLLALCSSSAGVPSFKISVFWNVTLCHWLSSCHHFKDTRTFIFRVDQFKKETAWWWGSGNCVPFEYWQVLSDTVYHPRSLTPSGASAWEPQISQFSFFDGEAIRDVSLTEISLHFMLSSFP